MRICFVGDVTLCMELSHLFHILSLILGTPSLKPRWRNFWMAPNEIFNFPKECLFEKYDLQLLQDSLEAFSGFNLWKWIFLVLLHSFICVRFLIASKYLNFLWCVFVKCVYNFFFEIWVIHTVAGWENLLCNRKAEHSWIFQIPLIQTTSFTDKFFSE